MNAPLVILSKQRLTLLSLRVMPHLGLPCSFMLKVTYIERVSRERSVWAYFCWCCLLKLAHEKLLQLAEIGRKRQMTAGPSKVHKKRPRVVSANDKIVKASRSRAMKDQTFEKTAKPQRSRKISSSEAFQKRFAKTKALGLHHDSATPMFSHTLTPEEIRSHPLINEWHAYRKALEEGKMQSNQLPFHFLSSRGDFQFF